MTVTAFKAINEVAFAIKTHIQPTYILPFNNGNLTGAPGMA
jgi:hypothetical protein